MPNLVELHLALLSAQFCCRQRLPCRAFHPPYPIATTRPALIDTGLTGAHSVGCCVRKHFLITTHNPIPLNSKIRIRAVCFLILHSVEKPSLGRIELAAARHAHVTIRW
ncbi:hypothetical protein FOYG_07301 [Fusarium oxysporum NRRL 32931]|uniref:Uncharacterized protein n=1 Tax=Fusarium oxysporum NRRL 32931 TaxID=660029 RepID=W9IIB1_FUSOX|nr:hypothetical protein FOYG_07301 [Fusarium oxysporum NRRL 32931]